MTQVRKRFRIAVEGPFHNSLWAIVYDLRAQNHQWKPFIFPQRFAGRGDAEATLTAVQKSLQSDTELQPWESQLRF